MNENRKAPDGGFIRVEPGDSPEHFRFHIKPEDCVGPADSIFMFGGVGMATGVVALEIACDRPLVWATTQYMSAGTPGQVMDLEVHLPKEGSHLVQAQITATIAGRKIYHMAAALGRGRETMSKTWRRPPVVLRPGEVDPVPHWRGFDDVHGRFEVRPVTGRYGLDRVGHAEPEGRLTMWMRPRDCRVDTSCLAVLADYVPAGIGNALGANVGGRSLDNTLRLMKVVPTEWVLVDVQIDAICDGLVHGRIALYAECGQLMAIGSQSLMLRVHDRSTLQPDFGS